MLERKIWHELVPEGVRLHLAIIPFTSARPTRLHTHDFPEVFWLEAGSGIHHINGHTKRVQTGDLIFVRPSDRHFLEAADEQGFTLINLAFDPGVRDQLLRRHPQELTPLFAPSTALPCRRELSISDLASLRRQIDRLDRTARSALPLEHFLLGLYDLVQPSTSAAAHSMPDWLRQACDAARRVEVFSRGVPGFVAATGRSSEHAARVTRAVLGLTPSAYINRIRMEYAARELRVTSRPIAEIALDCGLGNLSHFYALFRSAHRQTPRQYRLAHYRTVA